MKPQLQRVRDEAPGHDHLEKGRSAGEPGREKFRAKAMRQLHARVVRAYDQLVDRIFHELLRYIATEIVPGTRLAKSGDGFVDEVAWPDMVGFASASDEQRAFAQRKLSLLTPAQLETLKDIVRDYHAAFAAGAFGPDAIPPETLRRLTSTGVTPADLGAIFAHRPGEPESPPTMRITDLAYQYGALAGDPRQHRALERMGADDFVEHLENTRPQLSPVEQQAMGFARYNAGQYVRGMGDRLALEVGALIMDADAEQRRKYMGTVQRELEDAIDRKAAWRELASEIGHATEDWSRDMQRLAATEQQFAMQEGTARAISRGRNPKDVRVAKLPAPDACPDCVRLHLTAGRGSPPRIFSLRELTANGTNVGVKRDAWKATVGPVHPWCGCELVEVPEGWAFDDDGEMVPEIMLKKGDRLDALRKGEDEQRPHMTYGGSVPTDTLVIRVADPRQRQVVESIVKDAPSWLFRKDTGVTLITTDIPRAQNPLEEHDFAYWTGNEIRVNPTLAIERWPRVIRHELGHSLNVYLVRKLGSVDAVRAWHDRLWKVSEEEGFVSDYAKKLPIENAAEVTRMYLFEHHRLMLNYPRQFAMAHRAYDGAASPKGKP